MIHLHSKNINKREIKMLIKNETLEGLVDIFFPPACPICLRPRPIVEGIRINMCKVCRKKTPYIRDVTCFKCGKTLDMGEDEYCNDCKGNKHLFKQSFSVFEYTDSIKNSIFNFKYHNKKEFGKIYGDEMCIRLGDVIKRINPDVIVPVPISKERMTIRGYNQAELIARSVGENMNIPVDTNLIYRVKNTVAMKELDPTNRIKNLRNAFQITKNVVRYNKIIVVDDIYTTGATLDAVTKELTRFGNIDVYGMVLCVGQGF